MLMCIKYLLVPNMGMMEKEPDVFGVEQKRDVEIFYEFL